jgi:drug/metabolite transporter (DMT)-like permease
LVLDPFVTVLAAAWLLGEPLTAGLLLGAVLVVIGVWFGALAGQVKGAPVRTEATLPAADPAESAPGDGT